MGIIYSPPNQIQIFQKCKLHSSFFLKQITHIEHTMVEYKKIAPDFYR